MQFGVIRLVKIDKVLSLQVNTLTNDLVWLMPGNVPKPGDLLVVSNVSNNVVTFNYISPQTRVFNVNSNKILSIDDIDSLQICTGNTNLTITIPTDANVNIPILSTIEIVQDGTGTVTLQSQTGVNMRRNGTTATTGHILLGQYTSCIIRKMATNEWRVYGAIV